MSQVPLLPLAMPPAMKDIDLRCCDVVELFDEVRGARLVIMDPPWSYSNNGDPTRSAGQKYPCLPMRTIALHAEQAYDCAAEDAYLILWATFPLLGEWMVDELQGSIRWTYVTGGAWAKVGAPGAGFHWRGNAEPVLIYRKGRPKPTSTEILRSTHVTEQHRGRGARRWGDALEHSEKPIDWQRNMLRCWSSPGDLVLDVYAGLGSVARACLAEGRRYVGAEIDPDRHRIAMTKLAQGRGL